MQKQKYWKRTTLQLTRLNYTLQRKPTMMFLSTHPLLTPPRTSLPSYTGKISTLTFILILYLSVSLLCIIWHNEYICRYGLVLDYLGLCLPVQRSPISHFIFHITCKLIARNVFVINLIADHFMKNCL